MRQHVNPLSRYFQLPLDLPTLEDLFIQPKKPLHIDIGSANGKFLINLAPLYPEYNFIGLEIRRPLVLSSESHRKELEIENLKFLFCNVNVSLHDWLRTFNYKQLSKVSIQFPDPWFKKKHFKRRVVQPSLIKTIACFLTPGGELILQTDLLDMMKYMREIVELNGYFSLKEGQVYNLFPVKTEREIFVLNKGLPVYRATYFRNDKIMPIN